MDSHKHYMPVLRWKSAEKKAFKDLPTNLKDFVTPLIEILPSDKNPSSLSSDLVGKWDHRLIIFDVGLLDIQKQKGAMYGIYKLNSWGLKLVPALSLSDEPDLSSIVKNNGNQLDGVAFRITENNLINGGLAETLQKLKSKIGLSENQIDLIIDIKLRSERSLSLDEIELQIPNIEGWRSYTLLSGYFPENLGLFDNEISRHTYPRNDWLTWKDQIFLRDLKRKPAFGDYNIQHPLYRNVDKLRGSCSIRYTAMDHWLIMRGKIPKAGETLEQYLANANLLIAENDFSGKDFCPGDRYIYEKGQNYTTASTGNAGDWLYAGINHHISYVANQVANLD